MVDVAVWRIGSWQESKYDGWMNRRIMLKGLDDDKTYYLNQSSEPGIRHMWDNVLQNGNIIRVVLWRDNIVNKHMEPQLLERKPVNGEQDTSKKDGQGIF